MHYGRYRTTFDQGLNYDVIAVQVTSDNVKELVEWTHGQEVLEHDALDATKEFPGLNVQTSKGKRRASYLDWVIQSPAGDFHVHSDPIFKLLYEPKE